MTNDIEELDDIIPEISPELKEKFVNFFETIDHYNLRINLISKNSVPFAGVKHFSDSYQGLKLIEGEFLEGAPILDFGSGNGFPGLIGAMMYPQRKFILVERDQRKAEFLRIAADKLDLENVEVLAKNLSDLNPGSCQFVISRAMSPLPKFLLGTRQVVAEGASAYLFKGEYWSTEFSTIPPQLFEHWDVSVYGQYDLPRREGARYIIKCERVKSRDS